MCKDLGMDPRRSGLERSIRYAGGGSLDFDLRKWYFLIETWFRPQPNLFLELEIKIFVELSKSIFAILQFRCLIVLRFLFILKTFLKSEEDRKELFFHDSAAR